MRVMTFANMLVRDLKTKSLADLAADTIQEIVSAINASLQKLMPFGSESSRLTESSIIVNDPLTIMLGVTSGSTEITDYSFGPSDLNCTIRIGSDLVDNRVVDATTLLYPYRGPSGTVAAILYSDAVGMPENFLEVVGRLQNVDDGTEVFLDNQRGRSREGYITSRRSVARPLYFWVEENARNNNPNFPNVLRFDTLPDIGYRYHARVRLSTVRILFTDILTPAAEIPLLDSHVDAYLLPMVRGILTSSSMWEDKAKITAVQGAAERAYQDYILLANDSANTPANRIGTPPGW